MERHTIDPALVQSVMDTITYFAAKQMDEALMEQQRQAYKMAGVDENEPADVRVKRKADDEDGVSQVMRAQLKYGADRLHDRSLPTVLRSRRPRKRSAATPPSISPPCPTTSPRTSLERSSLDVA